MNEPTIRYSPDARHAVDTAGHFVRQVLYRGLLVSKEIAERLEVEIGPNTPDAR